MELAIGVCAIIFGGSTVALTWTSAVFYWKTWSMIVLQQQSNIDPLGTEHFQRQARKSRHHPRQSSCNRRIQTDSRHRSNPSYFRSTWLFQLKQIQKNSRSLPCPRTTQATRALVVSICSSTQIRVNWACLGARAYSKSSLAPGTAVIG